MKISIITAVFNSESTIENCIQSFRDQTYKNCEQIIIDGASSDDTLKKIHDMEDAKRKFTIVSEPDNGIYEAINKGIKISKGDIIGLLHSDDHFSRVDILEKIAEIFKNNDADIIYGDLDYVKKNNSSMIVRRWIAGKYNIAKLSQGWMPPHPTIFVRRELIESIGDYNTSYSISSDYDWILRAFKNPNIKIYYLPEVLIKMRIGGKSNQSLLKILQKMHEDYLIIKFHKLGGLSVLAHKNIRKISQFFT